MTRDQLEAVVREWQRRLNIPHWRIVINWNEPADPTKDYANIGRDGNSQYEAAELTFAANADTWSVELANEVVVHELMHLITSDLQVAAESAEDAMSTSAYAVFARRLLHEMEGVVDKLALLLVQFAGPFDPAREETPDVQHRTAA